MATTQRFMADRAKAKVKAHAVDHTPSVTAPAAVVDIIREADPLRSWQVKRVDKAATHRRCCARDDRCSQRSNCKQRRI
jgi:hypothetical protein